MPLESHMVAAAVVVVEEATVVVVEEGRTVVGQGRLEEAEVGRHSARGVSPMGRPSALTEIRYNGMALVRVLVTGKKASSNLE